MTTVKDILRVDNLSKSYGALTIISNLSMRVKRGERHGLIGPNGAGKTTLIGLLSGNVHPSKGEVRLNGESIVGLRPNRLNRRGIGRSFQITNIFKDMSVLDNVKIGVMSRRRLKWRLLCPASSLKDVEEEAIELVKSVGLAPYAHAAADTLSYSAQRSLEIAVTLATDPMFILLDEPMAGMSREETQAMTELLARVSVGRTLLMVEHDMSVVFSLCDRISVLVYGRILASGTPEEIRANADVQKAYLGEVTH
ncbi:ABC transporter ATP-binding protein [Bradyrhizobium sp. CCGB12]|uniref:ABC transporter ATP-binding protein n=1 Tax=Bradyrhizobium sp. CCGB12 TaxID=2949632 RepID=UPI0020B36CD4|nr:ABC transporter ATP-binding protein [Bradyrhizobium sp. CCGB12]MCP3387841.1 ABC transporter ATP-binding protein [Bradyrhizobium sp. CCGB12]